MRNTKFTIQQTPIGNWRLTQFVKGEAISMDLFNSRADAELGMARILRPIIYRYDENGDLIA